MMFIPMIGMIRLCTPVFLVIGIILFVHEIITDSKKDSLLSKNSRYINKKQQGDRSK